MAVIEIEVVSDIVCAVSIFLVYTPCLSKEKLTMNHILVVLHRQAEARKSYIPIPEDLSWRA